MCTAMAWNFKKKREQAAKETQGMEVKAKYWQMNMEPDQHPGKKITETYSFQNGSSGWHKYFWLKGW